jgi:hypothetical protein
MPSRVRENGGDKKDTTGFGRDPGEDRELERDE